MKYLFFDTETTGLSKTANIVSIAWLMANEYGVTLHSEYHIIKPEGWIIPEDSVKIHKITQANAERYGANINEVMDRFLWYVGESDVLVAHNIQFDQKIINNTLKFVLGKSLLLEDYKKRMFCTMTNSKEFVSKPSKTGKFKNPTLADMYTELFGAAPTGVLHNALTDVQVMVQCFYKLWGTPCELPAIVNMMIDLPALDMNIIYDAASAPIITTALTSSPTDPSDAV